MAGYVTLRIKTDEAQALEGFRKLTAAEREAVMESGRLARESRKTGGAMRRAGRSGVAEFTRLAATVGVATMAVGTLRQALRDMQREKREAGEALREQAPARGSLLQLAETPGELARLGQATWASRYVHGMGAERATELTYKLHSLGMLKQRPLFAAIGGMVGDPAEIAGGIDTMRAAFGARETGTVRMMLNKLLKASKVSRAKAEEFGAGMAALAPGAGQLKFSDEEVLAALAKVTRPAGGAGEAATQIRAFQKVLMKAGMGKRGLVGEAEYIGGLGLSPRQWMARFGQRTEALAGYANILKQAKAIRGLTAELYGVGAATHEGGIGPGGITGRDYIGRKLNLSRLRRGLPPPELSTVSCRSSGGLIQ